MNNLIDIDAKETILIDKIMNYNFTLVIKIN